VAITCPACSKSNQTQTVCGRCGCDLSRLWQVSEAAAAALAQARAALRAADWSDALAKAEDSWNLCHSVESARLAFLAAGALREAASAMTWHARASGSQKSS
jgi:hypothetical protein